ncbi:unannotated protein [freshwater metagenome]|uniref:Unannotated protein n=1 Tax=freshwater metagenome TaxID=449393 RepID=A0A6J7XTP8_9ZZZZ|nr:MBL fold metallo-hydrolase [Actinomycetota bacterium]
MKKNGLLLLLVGALVLGASIMSLRQESLQNSAITQYFDKNIVITAQVVTDPSRIAPKVRGSFLLPESYSFLARARRIRAGHALYTLRIPIRIITSKQEVASLLPGQTIRFSATVHSSKEARVAALVITRGEIEILTPPSRWARSLGAIRLGLRESSGDGDAGGLIPGMVLGDTSKQSPEFKTAMKRSGLTHLVAVSGANFAIVSSFLLWVMQFVIRRMRWRLGVTAIFLISFIALVRPSPSVLRAAAMAAVLLIAKGSQRSGDSLPALGFAIGAVIIADPWQSRDPGFALSVLATAGLLLFAPHLVAHLSRKMKPIIAQALAPPIAAILFCSPILLALSGYLSPMSIVANVLAAPVVAPITILGFIAALVHPLAPSISAVLIFLIRYPAAFIARIAFWSAGFPVIELAILTLAVFALVIFLARKRIKLLIIALIFIVVISNIQGWPAGDWTVANCDVGQGDSSVINLGAHRGIVIDVGPDPELVDKCLKDLGITQIPILILSHFHADHVAGLPGLEKSRTVGQVWVNHLDPSLAHLNQIVVSRGYSISIADASIHVLWPDSGQHSFASVAGDGSAMNNTSIAIEILTPQFSFFSAGDLEPEAQKGIVADLHHVDIYKVCHHGSSFQDPDFMRALSPQVALISVGATNSYGHPAPTTVHALVRLGAKVLRTDTDGAIAIDVQEHHVRIRTARQGFHLFTFN